MRDERQIRYIRDLRTKVAFLELLIDKLINRVGHLESQLFTDSQEDSS